MEKTIRLTNDQEAITLYGSLDERLRYAEEMFHVRVSARNHQLCVSGEKKNVKEAMDFFQAELALIRGDRQARPHELKKTKHSGDEGIQEGALKNMGISFFLKGKVIQAKGENQESYLQAIEHYDIVVGIGPAGTGKTYLAMACAVDHLKRKKVSRIILTRPAIEAGENLGFLPGDLLDKINHYLRPLYDALYDMMDFNDVARYLQRGIIEVAPLAYMRGRTLNDCFVILDEGQNCTHEQMKMFLTRLGLSSRAMITGDITQIDLPQGKRSGLVVIQKILHEIEGIKFCYFDDRDVVRHRLVQEIVKAYEKHGNQS